MYETYYYKLRPCFGQENFHFFFMDTDSFKLSVNTKKLVKNPKNFEDLFDFCNLNEKHVIFSNKNKKNRQFQN